MRRMEEGSRPARPAARVDARANVCQPGAERSSVDHYFFSVRRGFPSAVAAFGPVGASFR